jgi:Zn-dependent protease with chaperone function
MANQPRRPLLHEPAMITAAQLVGNLAAAIAGLLAAAGGMPSIVTANIGPVLAVGVGSLLFVGGLLGFVCNLLGAWWLERVALLIVGLGWICLLPASLTFAFNGAATGTIWLIVALIFTALSDVFKRYRRIDWAYLDPMRK